MTPATGFADRAAGGNAEARAWTCPFCALLCDRFFLRVDADALRLVGSDCPRARTALGHFGGGRAHAVCRIHGRPAGPDAALAAAAGLLRASRRPLFGGMATDVAGARALYPLAARLQAVIDHAGSAALLPGLRTLQDRGLYQTTLSEIRSRADLIVCLGTPPAQRYPEFWRLCGLHGDGDAPPLARRVVFVGTEIDPALAGIREGVGAESVALDGDWFATLTQLNALAAGRRAAAAPAIERLARDLQSARYAALVWEPGWLAAALPGTQAELLVESINGLLKTLNQRTRAGGLALTGDDGAASVNQVLAWLSGLPLRTAVRAARLDHDPRAFGAQRLLGQRAVDAVLWVASFGPQTAPPLEAIGDLPLVVLGHPALGEPLAARSAPTVFVPVATPGVGSAAHLFRLDGVVLLPLPAVVDDGLPSVADVAQRLAALLQEER